MRYTNVSDKAVRLAWVEESGQPPTVLELDPGETKDGPGGAYVEAFAVMSFGAVVPEHATGRVQSAAPALEPWVAASETVIAAPAASATKPRRARG